MDNMTLMETRDIIPATLEPSPAFVDVLRTGPCSCSDA